MPVRILLALVALVALSPAAQAAPPANQQRQAPNAIRPSKLETHADALRARLPAHFTVVLSPPFVVVGDEAPAVVRERAAGTVAWAARRLREDLGMRAPSRPLTVCLFRDGQSYRANARALFGDEPGTPYGYYSSKHDALVMNISTGGGTLVHEIVHPFMEATYAACPAWLNEGLGSLYEQCREEGGRIWGLTNWRLEGLQVAIRAGELPSLHTLVHTSDARFYGRGSGLHYAMARYLLLYLQEEGLLARYFAEAIRDQADDASGWVTLKRVLGERDMVDFQQRWERWVLALRFGG